jgi:hypothetical protein
MQGPKKEVGIDAFPVIGSSYRESRGSRQHSPGAGVGER